MRGLLVTSISAIIAISLVGCQDAESPSPITPVAKNEAVDKPRELTEAKNVSNEEKQSIFATLEAQERAFNEKDISAYMDTISKKPLSFDYNEEKEFVQSMFDTYDMTMDMDTKTIIEFNETEQTATVHIRTRTTVKEAENATMEALEDLSNQVVVLRKEDANWKIIQTFAMEQREN